MQRFLSLLTICSSLIVTLSLDADEIDSQEFSIVGDFSDWEGESSDVEVTLSITSYDAEGVEEKQVIARSLVEEQEVVLTGSVNVPRPGRLEILFDGKRTDRGTLILEPGASYQFTYRGPFRQVVFTGGGERHQRTLGYQTEAQFLELDEKYGASVVKWFELSQMKEQEKTEIDSVEANEPPEDTSIDTPRTVSIHGKVLDWDNMDCSDWGNIDETTPVEVEPSTEAEQKQPEQPRPEPDELELAEREMYSAMGERAMFMREQEKKIMEEVATDAIDRLLAMEQDAYGYTTKAIAAFDALEEELDTDIFQSRAAPKRDMIANLLKARKLAKTIVPGTSIPNFVLPDVSGEQHSLEGILTQYEVVLVDFWASWCGPCIEQFPHLKELHAEFQDKGFEVVGVSIDETAEEWQEATETYEFPWINLAELKDFTGPVAVEFGVEWIPMSYVLDSEGCILKKDLETDELADFLNARLGESIE
ncbi:MAG: TlpA disulfide reductase family protein [Gammaproteobacteria bacterium]|nr:TlpA disulfide reductase family protein [Gammaproteobacteria bacterium]